MDYYFYFVQIIGVIAFGLSLCSYQFKSQRILFGIRVCSDGLWALHYLLLSAITPALTVAVACIRTYLSIFIFPQYKTVIIVCAICVVIILCILFAGDEWQNYLPIMTALLFGLSNYFHDDYWKSRILMACGLCIWIVIGIVFGSYAEIVSSGFGLLSLFLGFYRHRKVSNKTGHL
jgi:hypothetical protein